MVTIDRYHATASSEYRSRNGTRVTTLQVHHMAGLSLSVLLDLMQPGGRKVSANFALSASGELINVVPLNMRAFTSASSYDERCYTVETVNTSGSPNWGISDASHERLARLLAEMHKELGTKLAYGDGGLIFHRDVPGTYATSCPGPSMDGDRIIRRAKEIVGAGGATPTPAPPKPAPAPSRPASSNQVRQGERGDRARWVLDRLAAHGYYRGYRNDAHLGPIGVRELKKFQRAKGLQVDGWLTWGSGQTYSALAAAPKSNGGSKKPAPASSGKFSVRALQQFLKTNYPAYAGHLVVDNIYGNQTRAVVREFQRRSGLTVDGVVGPQQTLPALRRAGFRG